MALFRFRIRWDEDEQIFRDIILKSGQTFDEFQLAILKSFEFKTEQIKSSSFFESNDRWLKGREISSEVLSNIKGASVLSMIKTPVSALVNQPEKRFLFEYDPEKQWLFLVTLIDFDSIEDKKTYPLLVRSEGLSPAGENLGKLPSDRISEMEDQFDLESDDMDEDGFGEEGEEGEEDAGFDF